MNIRGRKRAKGAQIILLLSIALILVVFVVVFIFTREAIKLAPESSSPITTAPTHKIQCYCNCVSGDRSQRVSFSPEEGQACSSYDGDRCEFRDNDITYIGLLESCDAEIVPVDDEIRR